MTALQKLSFTYCSVVNIYVTQMRILRRGVT